MTKILKRKHTLCQLFVILSTLFLISSCKDQENNNIPLVQVDFIINIDDPSYLNLKTIGGSVEVNGGSRGILLYRLSNETINAFDRHCTFQPSNTCAIISANPNSITATDHCCGSVFLLGTGEVSQPPASVPLKQYNTSFDGKSLRVFN